MAWPRKVIYFDGLAEKSNIVLASYSNTTYAMQHEGREVYTGPAIEALAKVLTGQLTPQGKSPMIINTKNTH